MDSAWREDYLDFGDSIKPFYHKSPKSRESPHPANFVLEEISRLNRNNNYAITRDKNDKRFLKNDEKFYVPKSAPPTAPKPKSQKTVFSANVENLNRLFAKNSFVAESGDPDDKSEIETKYFDSLTPYSEESNLHYIEKLQEDIRNLRNEGTKKPRDSTNLDVQKKLEQNLIGQSPKLKVCMGEYEIIGRNINSPRVYIEYCF